MPVTGHVSGGSGERRSLADWWCSRPERERLAFAGLLLFLAVFAVYGQTTGFDFNNFDDPPYVTENPPVARGLSADGLVWALTTGHTGMWHPVTWLSHMLDVSLFGMKPAGHHLTNVVLHALSAILLFTFLRGATQETGRSLVVALFFALHPLNVETVAWVSQRKSVLSAFFFMLTLLAWLGHVRGRRGAAPTAWICYALGLMAKPMLVTLPALLLLLDVWPLRRLGLGWKRLVLEKWPFYLLTCASLFMLLFPPVKVDTADMAQTVSWLTVQHGLANYLSYLGLLAWPWPLGVLYPKALVVPAWGWGGGLVVLLGVTWWLARRGRPDSLVGWLWFGGVLFPVVGVMPLNAPQGIADRYAYLPAIGLFIALVWAWRGKAWLGATLAGIVTAAWAGVASIQTGYWRDSLTLWSHTAAITPANPTLLLNHGAALYAAGRIAEAETSFLQLETLAPQESRASLNLAVIYERQGKLALALEAARRSVELAPGNFRARSNYASLLTSSGQPGKAEEQLLIVITQHPDFAGAWINLGILHVEAGRIAEAAKCFERALAIQPDSAAARQNLELARRQLQQSGASIPRS